MKNNKTATIKRLQLKAGSTSVKEWNEIGSVAGMFLPLSQERSQIAREQGIIGKAFMFYVEKGTDILETDRLVIDTISYDVKGIKKYDVGSNIDHLEILLEERKK